jgi:hypothetical protein
MRRCARRARVALLRWRSIRLVTSARRVLSPRYARLCVVRFVYLVIGFFIKIWVLVCASVCVVIDSLMTT